MIIKKVFLNKLLYIFTIVFFFNTDTIAQNVKHYDLYVKDTFVNFTRKTKRAIAVNGQIPMPTLTFTEGDTAEIVVHNDLNESTSLHWHGLFLPNKEDGVPNLTQMAIKAKSTFTYRFAIIQHGTHWYHSHSGLQEQLGMYGSFIINKKKEDSTFRKGIDDIPTYPIIISDWTDYKPENIHRMLHNASDWFSIKKGTTQSYFEALRQGYLGVKLKNEWKRQKAMDVSDIYYDKFLINGINQNYISQLPSTFKSGDKVRLRITNGSASTYFWLNYAGGKITVVANDGNDIEPIEVDRLIIAVSESYDVIITIPNDSIAYEFLATAEDRTKSTSIYIGNGSKQLISSMPKLKYFEGMKMMNDMMKMNGKLNDMNMNMSLNKMDMNVVMYPEITGNIKSKNKNDNPDRYNGNTLADIVTLNYSMLKSTTNTSLPKDAPIRTLKFNLSGNMNRYVWSIDNRVVSETDKILINKGENVRIIIYNGSMMRHPMHLHGHDFRLLNGQGDYAPLKNIVDIMPMETDTLEFNANADGDWFFHCHILYHMMSGMGRVFTYNNQAVNPLITNPKLAQRKLFADDRKFHIMLENDFAFNGNDGMLMIQNTRWSMGTEWRLGYTKSMGFETETHLGRYFGRNQFFLPFIGFDLRYRKNGMNEVEKNIFGQKNSKDNRTFVSIGFNYTLPMLLIFQAELYHNGNVRLQLMREDIPISNRIRAGFMINTDKEYMVDLGYIINKNMRVRIHYDSDMGFGAGIKLNY